MGLDTVEIVMCWEEAFGLTMPDSAAEKIETPAMAVDYWCERLNASDEAGSCLTWSAFKRLRDSLAAAGTVPRNRIKLGTRLASLWKGAGRAQFWSRFVAASGFSKLRKPGLMFGPGTVRDLLLNVLTSEALRLIKTDGKWSRQDVRTVVRASVRNYADRPFRDDEHFIGDLGLC